MTGEVWHGGDLGAARALFPGAPEPWIDLSTGINPCPYPLPALPLSLWQTLPSAREEEGLLAAARKAYRVPPGMGIVAAPGTQILIELLPRLFAAEGVAVLGPTYAEHALAWGKAGHRVQPIETTAADPDASSLVLVNPNNPDGRVVPQPDLERLAARCRDRGGILVVDEAFADFTPEISIVPTLPPATIVLRSFGKTYGLAGLRVGFAIGEPRHVEALRDALGPWAVAGPALRVAATALSDESWLAQAARARQADAKRLDGLLAPRGRVLGGTDLFRLLETQAAAALFDHLGKAGIYVRRFQNAPNRLRFGLPADGQAWARLSIALQSAFR